MDPRSGGALLADERSVMLEWQAVC